MVELIICPWCLGAMVLIDNGEEKICPICRRVINEEDIEEAVLKEED